MGAIGNEKNHVHHTLHKAAIEDTVQNDTVINITDTTELINTAVSNDENNVDMQYVTASATAMKGSVDDDSSDESRLNAASSPASKRTDTAVSKEGRKSSAKDLHFSLPPLNQGNRGPIENILTPIRPQQGGGGVLGGGININHEKPAPPPKPKESHVKTPPLINHRYISQLHKSSGLYYCQNNSEVYNKPFRLRYLRRYIMKAKPRAPGPDGIHNNLMKHLIFPRTH